MEPLTQTGAELIAAERTRQVTAEGWTAEHDDAHHYNEMEMAARAYHSADGPEARAPEWWPWEAKWWKPKDRVRNLVRAGALYQAEADRRRRTFVCVTITPPARTGFDENDPGASMQRQVHKVATEIDRLQRPS